MKKTSAKLAAVIAALTMCLTTACGSVEDSAPAAAKAPEQTETAAEENTPEETEADTKEEPAETTEKIEIAAQNDAPGSEARTSDSIFNDINSLILNDDACEYDKDKVYNIAELMLGRYDLIIDRDKQGYFDSINFPMLFANVKSIDPYLGLAEDEDESEENYFDSMFGGAAVYTAVLAAEGSEELLYSMPDGTDKAEYKKKLSEAYEKGKQKLTPDTATQLFSENSPYNCFFGSDHGYLPESFPKDTNAFRISADKGAVFLISVSDYLENEKGTFAEIGVAALQGDWQYSIEGFAWLNGGESSIIIDDIEIGENDYKGMALKDLKTAITEKSKLKTLNANAKTGYNCAAEFICDKEIEGVSLDEVFKSGAFKKLNSKEGLSLNTDMIDTDKLGEGDKRFVELFGECGVSGTIYIGRTKINGEDTFFIQYKNDESGVIGQYPDCIFPEDTGKVVWGTFFANEYTDKDPVDVYAETARQDCGMIVSVGQF